MCSNIQAGHFSLVLINSAETSSTRSLIIKEPFLVSRASYLKVIGAIFAALSDVRCRVSHRGNCESWPLLQGILKGVNLCLSEYLRCHLSLTCSEQWKGCSQKLFNWKQQLNYSWQNYPKHTQMERLSLMGSEIYNSWVLTQYEQYWSLNQQWESLRDCS